MLLPVTGRELKSEDYRAFYPFHGALERDLF